MKTRNKILIGTGIAALVAVIGFYIYTPLLIFGPIEPLHFSIHNNDVDRHNIAVEVFDSGNKSIFKETYELVPKERTDSPEITKKRGNICLKSLWMIKSRVRTERRWIMLGMASG